MKCKANKIKPVKKVGKDFCGTCELRQLSKGSYFRTVDKNGKVSKEAGFDSGNELGYSTGLQQGAANGYSAAYQAGYEAAVALGYGNPNGEHSPSAGENTTEQPAQGGNTTTETPSQETDKPTTEQPVEAEPDIITTKKGFNWKILVAFNTDKPIDKLLEADVYYTKQSYTWQFVTFLGESKSFGEKTDEYAYLKYTDKVEHNGGGLFAGTYRWDRIETTEQFIAENDLTQNVYSGAIIDVSVANKITDEGKAALRSKKWVLRFAETSYTLTSTSSPGSSVTTEWTTLVGDVTILRLKFETDGVTYNLGTIDNKQTGSDKSINDEHLDIGLSKSGKWILALIALLLLLWILGATGILPLIIKGLAWVVCLPFRAIGALFKAIINKSTNSKQVNKNGKNNK